MILIIIYGYTLNSVLAAIAVSTDRPLLKIRFVVIYETIEKGLRTGKEGTA